jgi:hypothetical protein
MIKLARDKVEDDPVLWVRQCYRRKH